ncbi:T9SS type A sorting domain-containing protein [Crocinitomicaceae bacterium]|nr:T9SS type A sorting domain-containing protein [Crocinitomicaceae bacterium]
MKKSIMLLVAFCGLMVTTSSAQIIQAMVPDIGIWGPVNNTGIAIAPFYHWNAIAFDDGSGDYHVQWRDAGSGAFLDMETQPGTNPDVAYYANADALVVAYENGGDIWIDDYFLSTFVDYNLGSQNGIAGGTNPNIDMNSLGDGALIWQDGSDIWAQAFNIGSYYANPPLLLASGQNPDIALLDDNSNIVITYTNGGMLFVETFDYNDFASGTINMTTSNTISPSGFGFEFPRVQSNRNSNFGPADLYTVVAQDDLGGSQYLIHGIFYTGLGSPNHVKLNLHAYNCFSPAPLPVVAYDRSQVHVAWAQEYSLGCSGINPVDNGQDVLLAECDFSGNNLNGLTVFLEVNEINADFSNSKTSINTEYDGNYSINNSNYCEGLAYDYPGDLLWKRRDPSIPVFRSGAPGKLAVTVEKGVTENLITVEVSTSDEMITENDLDMSFALYDQSGRLVETPEFDQEGKVFRIDASSLEHGIYLLQYTLNGESKAERIAHFVN